MLDYYQVLGCERDASVEELRKGFREAAKKAHPDKNGGGEEFVVVKDAWTTLSDPSKRKEYDRELRKRELADLPLYCHVELREMSWDEDSEGYTMDCRCGGTYRLSKEEVSEAEEVSVACDFCTFYIRVKVVD